jgi:hypothetical protein
VIPAEIPAVLAVPALHEIVVALEIPALIPAVVAVPMLHAMTVAADIPAEIPAVVALPGVQVIVTPPPALGIHILLSFFLNSAQGLVITLCASSAENSDASPKAK